MYVLTGQVNECAPRTFGDGVIHMSQFNALVQANMPLPEMPQSKPSKSDDFIGKLLADNLIEDGATLQLGLFCRFIRYSSRCSYFEIWHILKCHLQAYTYTHIPTLIFQAMFSYFFSWYKSFECNVAG